MRVEFHGAARTVTGSCTLLESSGTRVLVDCGQFQGDDELEARNRGHLGFRGDDMDALVLTHAHIDHCGRAPLLMRRGFRGRVLCTRATAALAGRAASRLGSAGRRAVERGDAPAGIRLLTRAVSLAPTPGVSASLRLPLCQAMNDVADPTRFDAQVSAAIAEATSLTVLHYDADFDHIAAVTGQPTQWIVERGSID